MAGQVTDAAPPSSPPTLRLDDLHPVIVAAAKRGWERGDLAQAVRDAWFALRDLLRERLEEPDLDGVGLVNAIGEDKDPIRLPLTEYVTTSERNMHRGLVNLLRGVVYYVRNPDAHTPEANVSRIGALERLALMSLCARHVESAARPTAVADVVEELLQTRVQLSAEAMVELIETIPVRRRGELASALLEAARRAQAEGQRAAVNVVRRAYPLVLAAADADLLAASARDCGALVARDETFELGLMLLPQRAYPLLSRARRERVTAELLKQARAGPHGATSLSQELAYLYPILPDETRQRIMTALESRLFASGSTKPDSAFAQAIQMRSLSDADIGRLTKAMVAFLAAHGSDQNVERLEFALERDPDFRHSKLRGAFEAELTLGEPYPAGSPPAKAVAALRAHPARA